MLIEVVDAEVGGIRQEFMMFETEPLRELITVDEVRRIDEDKMIVIAHNKPVVIDEKNSYYLNHKYDKRYKHD